MESHARQSAGILERSALPVEELNKPRLIIKAYSNVHTYNIGNQQLALVQCYMRGLQPSPITPFRNGKDLADTPNAVSEH